MTPERRLIISGYPDVLLWRKFPGGAAVLCYGPWPRRKPHYIYHTGEFRT